MKKNIYYLLTMLVVSISLSTSCKQEPKMPTNEEIAQKVQDKYGAELGNLKKLKEMECEESIHQKVSERLSATAAK